jgi:hypothetical protein
MKKNKSLEEAMNNNGYNDKSIDTIWREGVEFGAKWQAELGIEMRKEFAIKTLNRIKEMDAKLKNLSELGIEFGDFLERYSNLLEEAVAMLFTDNDTDKDFEKCLDDVLWWLYDKSDKIVTINGIQKDVTEVEHFVDYLEQNYSK